MFREYLQGRLPVFKDNAKFYLMILDILLSIAQCGTFYYIQGGS
jgi:hypothetical protein